VYSGIINRYFSWWKYGGNMKKRLIKKTVSALPIREKAYRVFDTSVTGFYVHVTPTGRKTFYLRFVSKVDGKRKDYNLGKLGDVKVSEARERAEILRGEINQGADPQLEKQSVQHAIQVARISTLRAFLNNAYANHVRENRKTAEEALRRTERQFSEWLDRPLAEISEWDIRSWRQAEQKKDKKNTTINRDLAELSALLSHAVHLQVIEKSPFDRLKPLKVDERKMVRYLTDEEESALIQALRDRDQEIRGKRQSANQWRLDRGYEPLKDFDDGRFVDHIEPMILLSLNTGLRRGELFQLQWENVDWNKNRLVIEGHTTKNRKTRFLPLVSETLKILWDWMPNPSPDGLVFPGQDGAPLTDVKKGWRKVMLMANISNFRWHDLRHHFASRLVQTKADLYRVSQLLGHSSIKVTERYAHLDDAALRETMELLTPKSS